MSVPLARLAVASALSIVPLAWTPLAERLSDTSRVEVAALPWLVCAGLPYATPRVPVGVQARSHAHATSDRAGWSFAAWSAPVLAIATRLDVDAGRARLEVALAGLVVLACIALLAQSAWRARARGNIAAHAALWIALVPGLPLAWAALEVGGRPVYGEAPRLVAWLARASPLAWAWTQARAPLALSGAGRGIDAAWLARAAPCVLVCIGLLAAASIAHAKGAEASRR